MTMRWPTSPELTNTLLEALKDLGGEADSKTLDALIVEKIQLSPELAKVMRSGNRSEISYRLAWIRTKAKQGGLVTKELNRNWKLTSAGSDSIKS